MERPHSALSAYGCGVAQCRRRFATVDRLTLHRRTCRPTSPAVAKRSRWSADAGGAQGAAASTSAGGHRPTSSGGRPMRCGLCDKVATCIDALLCHVRTAHSEPYGGAGVALHMYDSLINITVSPTVRRSTDVHGGQSDVYTCPFCAGLAGGSYSFPDLQKHYRLEHFDADLHESTGKRGSTPVRAPAAAVASDTETSETVTECDQCAAACDDYTAAAEGNAHVAQQMSPPADGATASGERGTGRQQTADDGCPFTLVDERAARLSLLTLIRCPVRAVMRPGRPRRDDRTPTAATAPAPGKAKCVSIACPLCPSAFGRLFALNAHLLADHPDAGADDNMQFTRASVSVPVRSPPSSKCRAAGRRRAAKRRHGRHTASASTDSTDKATPAASSTPPSGAGADVPADDVEDTCRSDSPDSLSMLADFCLMHVLNQQYNM